MKSKLALTAIIMVAAIMGIGSVAPAAFAEHKEQHDPPGQSKDPGCGAKWTLITLEDPDDSRQSIDINDDDLVCEKTTKHGKVITVDNEIEEEEVPEVPEAPEEE